MVPPREKHLPLKNPYRNYGFAKQQKARKFDRADKAPPQQSASHFPDAFPRNKVDAETLQYYAEISSLLAMCGSITDPEERAALSANALEETQGKEPELACDRSCSRVLEMLVNSCDIMQVTSFLHRISPYFAFIANDASGSHVAEAVLKSMATALHGYDGECLWYNALKQGLAAICQVVGERAADMMTNCYGSHVLRRLLSLLSGATMESSLDKKIRRLSNSIVGNVGNAANNESIPFPDLLHNLVAKLLEVAKKNIAQLHEDPFTGPVLQAILKILEGNHTAITRAIMIFLGCDSENGVKDDSIVSCGPSSNLKQLIFDNSGSHLVEVMLEVAPDAVYTKLFQEICSYNVLELSLHRSANFVVQALITSARHQDQVNILYEALGSSFLKLIKEMRSGVISSMLIACKRFCTREQEACQVLAEAINPEFHPPACLVPRLLFLESYARGEGTTDWKPAFGKKLSVLGCALLQTIFSYSKECNQQFWLSFTALESADFLTIVKDSGGCHVVEAFLISNAPWEHKNNVISKLMGHFGELALCMLSSFTVEKCFSVGDITLKEAIASELALVRSDLERTKHGPHLIRKCDVMGYSKLPDQWRQRMSVKQDTLKEFSDVFNPGSKYEINSGKNVARKREGLRVVKPGKPVNREVLDVTRIAEILGSEAGLTRQGLQRKRKPSNSEGNVIAIDPVNKGAVLLGSEPEFTRESHKKRQKNRDSAETVASDAFNSGSIVDMKNGVNDARKTESLNVVVHGKNMKREVGGANNITALHAESRRRRHSQRTEARGFISDMANVLNDPKQANLSLFSHLCNQGNKTNGQNNASNQESSNVARHGKHLSRQVFGANKVGAALGLEHRSTWEFPKRKQKSMHSAEVGADLGMIGRIKKLKRKVLGVHAAIIMKKALGLRKLKKKRKSMQHS